MDLIKNFSNIVEKVFESVTHLFWVGLWLFLLSGLLIFVNPNLLETLQIKDFRDTYADIIGIIFVASALVLILIIGRHTVNAIKKFVVTKYITQIELKRKAKSIADLNDGQIGIIVRFIVDKTVVLTLDSEHEDVQDLVNKRIIYGRRMFTRRGDLQEYTLDPWIRSHFKKALEKPLEKHKSTEKMDNFINDLE